MKGHSEPDRASSFSPLLHSPHHLLSLFQPSFSQEQNNKLNWEKTREVCPHLWHPLKGCYWKRIQKCEEGFCVSLFLEALGGLCAPNLERLEWSFLHRSHSLVATTKKTLPIACHASEFRGFEKTLNRACDFFSLVFFFFFSPFLLRPLCSLLSVSPLLPTTTPAVGTRVRGAGGQVTSGVKKTSLSKSPEPDKGIGFSENFWLKPASAAPPNRHLAFPERPVSSGPRKSSYRDTQGPTSGGVCWPTVLRKLSNTFLVCSHIPSTHRVRRLFYRGGCYWI